MRPRVEPGRGYVEIQRRYRVTRRKTSQQVLLLGYRLERSGWSLVSSGWGDSESSHIAAANHCVALGHSILVASP